MKANRIGAVSETSWRDGAYESWRSGTWYLGGRRIMRRWRSGGINLRYAAAAASLAHQSK
jgi:hypothetical protein